MFYNQQKVSSGQIPKKVVWRKRAAYFKNIIFWIMVLAVGYQAFAINSLEQQQVEYLSSQVFEDDSLSPNDFLDQQTPQLADSSNQLTEQLSDFIVKVANSNRFRQKLQLANSDLNKLESQLQLPDNYEYNEFQIRTVPYGTAIASFAVDQLTAEYVVNLSNGQRRFSERSDYLELIADLNNPSTLNTQRSFAATNIELKNLIKDELENDQNTKNLLKEKELSWTETATSINFNGREGTMLLTIKVNPEKKVYYLNNDNKVTFGTSELPLKLAQALNRIDARTELERITADQLEGFNKVVQSESFKAQMRANNLILETVTEKPDGYYYRFVGTLDDSVVTIILERGTALIKVVDDGKITSLTDFLSGEDKKKTINIPTDLDTTNLGSANSDAIFLLAGKHGSLTDTLMIAYAFDKAKTVKLISLPRDLYWQDRKINSYFSRGGMDDLVEQLEKITEVKFDNYALIDMYAFIDVINILGGVDITLNEAVIDPTYKTFDDGVWGTLHYEPGNYHLNGVQALRLARSRHSSSDFARAARQQQIMQALQTKAQQLSIKDLPKIIALARAVISKLETNIGLSESIDFYKKYKDYDVVNAGVLSSGNVLTSTYSNQAGFEACLRAGGSTECSKGAYILLPKNKDWRVIPWYINSLLQN